MLTKFWENMGEGLSGKLLDRLLSPAFIFWGGGLLILAGRYGFNKTWHQIQALNFNTQLAAIFVGLLILSLSSELIDHLSFPALRMLEGYWHWPFHLVGKPLIVIHQRNAKHIRNQWNELKNKEDQGTLARDGRKKISELEKQLHYYPADSDDFLPTSLGNAIRAGESAPYHKYGLDAVVCWPRLWLLLPVEVQEELSRSRQSLDRLVKLVIWGMLFLFWAWWWPWVILIGLVWMVSVYDFAVQSAMTYADLLESAFDLHRFELYRAARWPKPKKSGEEEVSAGKQLTEFLWRGTTEKSVRFVHGKD